METSGLWWKVLEAWSQIYVGIPGTAPQMHSSCRLHAVMVPRVPVKEGPVIPVTGETVSGPHIWSRPFVRQSILDLDDWWLWECKGIDMPTWKEQLRGPIIALGPLACRGICVCVWNGCWLKLSDVQHDNSTPPYNPVFPIPSARRDLKHSF